jgi:hypothetical protein
MLIDLRSAWEARRTPRLRIILVGRTVVARQRDKTKQLGPFGTETRNAAVAALTVLLAPQRRFQRGRVQLGLPHGGRRHVRPITVRLVWRPRAYAGQVTILRPTTVVPSKLRAQAIRVVQAVRPRAYAPRGTVRLIRRFGYVTRKANVVIITVRLARRPPHYNPRGKTKQLGPFGTQTVNPPIRAIKVLAGRRLTRNRGRLIRVIVINTPVSSPAVTQHLLAIMGVGG